MPASSGVILGSFSLLFSAAIVGGLGARAIKLPLVIGYIVAGIVLGNLFPQFIDRSLISIVADIGIILLLFTLGIEFSFQRFRKVLGLIGWAAVVQILLTFLAGHLFFLAIGFPFFAAFFIGLAGAFSSTAVVVKLLAENAQLETTHGEIITAWLIVQDLAVIPIMLLLPAISTAHPGETTVSAILFVVGRNLLKAGLILILVLSLGRRFMPWVATQVGKLKNREIFVVTTVAVVFLAGSVSYALGLSPAIGAFLSGLLMAETSQNHAIFSEVRPLRDIFAVMFFVALGFVVPFSTIFRFGGLLVVGTVGLLLVKSFLVFGLGKFLGFHRKTAVLAAIALLPMSEFGFILAQEGNRLGVLNIEHYLFLVALTFLTILVGSPMLGKSHHVYVRVSNILKHFPKLFEDREAPDAATQELPFSHHVVLCGYGRVGKYIGRALAMASVPFVVIDYNSATVSTLKERGIPVVFGDPGDIDVLDYAQVDKARVLIIAIPDRHTQELIIAHAQTLNKGIHIICRTHYEEDQKVLKALGVDVIIQPEFEAAISIVSRLLSNYGVTTDDINGKITRLKIEHGLG